MTQSDWPKRAGSLADSLTVCNCETSACQGECANVNDITKALLEFKEEAYLVGAKDQLMVSQSYLESERLKAREAAIEECAKIAHRHAEQVNSLLEKPTKMLNCEAQEGFCIEQEIRALKRPREGTP